MSLKHNQLKKKIYYIKIKKFDRVVDNEPQFEIGSRRYVDVVDLFMVNGL